jgi:pimeloyl-ACP methyl ester carboxylesterase
VTPDGRRHPGRAGRGLGGEACPAQASGSAGEPRTAARTEDLKKITVPALVMHGHDDQIVPYADSGPLSAELLQNGTLKTYKGFPHGCPTTQAETINADLLAFLQS